MLTTISRTSGVQYNVVIVIVDLYFLAVVYVLTYFFWQFSHDAMFILYYFL